MLFRSLSEHISAILPLDSFVPAPAQGVLAVQCRSNDKDVIALLAQLDDPSARTAVTMERAVLAAMRGGCSIPLGVYAQCNAESITITGMISDIAGKTCIQHSLSGILEESKIMAHQLATLLLDKGGRDILEDIRKSI